MSGIRDQASDGPTRAGLSERKARGEEAQRLLEHPLLVEAFAAVDAALWRQFKSSTIGNDEELRNIREMTTLAGMLLSFLREVMSQGEAAKLELTKLDTPPRKRIHPHV